MSDVAVMLNYPAVRQRLRNPPNAVPDYGIDLKRKPKPPEIPVPEPTVILPAKVIPPDPAEIIEAVAKHLMLTVQSIMFDIGTKAREGRAVAIGLVMLRLNLDRDAAAEIFGVLPESADCAQAEVKSILRDRMVPLGIPINDMIVLLCRESVTQYTIREVQDAVCAASGFTPVDLKSSRRTADVIAPRHLAMALAKRLTKESLPSIGRHFGGRDHTTVINACRKMNPIIDRVAEHMPAHASVKDWVKACLADV